MKVAFHTFGCKLNQYETMAMAESLRGYGYEVVPFENKADIYVVNTCTVTEKTDVRCRQLIRRTAKANPLSVIVAAGCYAQRDPRSLASLPCVKLVLGNGDKIHLAEKLKDLNTDRVTIYRSDPGSGQNHSFPVINSFGSYTRAFIKIQEGCDNQCAYCVVRNVRGPNRSEEEKQVLYQVRTLSEAGYREMVLTGIHLGSWGLDLEPAKGLPGLLEKLAGIENGPKIRLSSIEPNEFDQRLIKVIDSNPKICRHFHIPLQSGSDEILRRMHRIYTADEYRRIISGIMKVMPEAAIGTDIMVGFPGETEDCFRESLGLVEELPFAYLHVFNYSRRPGTEAALMDGQVSPEIRKERSRRMRVLGLKKAAAYGRNFLGRELNCLIEAKRDKESGMLKAVSDNYLKILLEGPDSLYNRYAGVIIDKLDGKLIYGHLKE